MRSAAACVLIGTAPAAAVSQQGTAAPTSLVFDGVTVVDVEQAKLIPDQRVVITGNRIQAMGSASAVALPKGAQVAPAKDKYLIPGLWDMHVHVNASRWFENIAAQDSLYRERYPRLIAHGVTGIREMGQRFRNGADSFRVWQREVMAGSLGTVAPGKLADLVLLDADPLTDITSVLKVRAVVANGRYFDRPALDALDVEGVRPGRGMVPVEQELKKETGVDPKP